MARSEAARRPQTAAAVAFAALAAPALGLAALAAWVLSRRLPICWPGASGGAGCALFFGAGLLCWLLAASALAAGAAQCARTSLGLLPLLRRRRRGPDPRLMRLMQALGVRGPTVVVSDSDFWAVTHGLSRPRIALSSGLLAGLSDDELSAVLLHEEHHRRCREPLRLALARTARSVLWFLPAAGRLCQSYAAAAELAADAAAMDRIGRLPLAQALGKLCGASLPAGAVRFAPGAGLFRLRIEQIARYPEPAPDAGPRWTDALTTALAVAAAALWALACLHL
jgi:Zn-dependent protease with chaperone function